MKKQLATSLLALSISTPVWAGQDNPCADLSDFSNVADCITSLQTKIQEQRFQIEALQQQSSLADTAQNTANDARNQADVAISKADMAQNTANDAKNRAINAQNTANVAISKADTAQNTANDAKNRAINAQNTANNAVSKANAAQNTANTALSKANDAISKANAAANAWPPGHYCIGKRGNCPPGFQTASIGIDAEDSGTPANHCYGPHPASQCSDNVRIGYCCK